ncbi:hypothetical protein KR018_008920 [Drosophila ironensis]|nr:hypothetical protein KR018_008920 [Drosophila ironensis]
MSYQIKSTPYFRRMFNNSKKNGQLQRLREEYERIQEFNDRTIELKMRQVRLKRLFREIEEIKEGTAGAPGGGTGAGGPATGAGAGLGLGEAGNPAHGLAGRDGRRRRQNNRLAVITPEQRRHHQRVEALVRARELGMEISRRNAELAESGGGAFLRHELRSTAKMQAAQEARREAVERRERAAKRISYGNDQSRQNLMRQLQVRQRRLVGGHSPVRAGHHTQSASLTPAQQLPHPHQDVHQHLQQHRRRHNHQTAPRGSRQKQYQVRYVDQYPDFRQLTDSQLDFLAQQAREEQQQRFRRQNDDDEEQDEAEEAEAEDVQDAEDAEDAEAEELVMEDEERFRCRNNYLENACDQQMEDEEEQPSDVEPEADVEINAEPEAEPDVEPEVEPIGGGSEEELERQLVLKEEQLLEELQLLNRGQQEEDEDEEADEELQVRDDAAPVRLPVPCFSLSSGTTMATAATPTTGTSHPCGQHAPDNSEMKTSIAASSQAATIGAHQPVGFVPLSSGGRKLEHEDEQEMCKAHMEQALHNWRKVSLMLPFFKSSPDTKTPSSGPSMHDMDCMCSFHGSPPLDRQLFQRQPHQHHEHHEHHYQQEHRHHQEHNLHREHQHQHQPQQQHQEHHQHHQEPQQMHQPYRTPHSDYYLSIYQYMDTM